VPYPLVKKTDHPVTNFGSLVNRRMAKIMKKKAIDPSAKLGEGKNIFSFN